MLTKQFTKEERKIVVPVERPRNNIAAASAKLSSISESACFVLTSGFGLLKDCLRLDFGPRTLLSS